MNKILLLLIFLISATISFSQTCPTSSIRLASQADVDNFSILYPDCTDVNFNIRIGGESEDMPSDITNLSGLSKVESIKNIFFIENNPNLESLTGLENLKSVSGTFQLANNAQLADISQLQSIESIGFVSIASNHLLNDYSIFSQLTNSTGFGLYDNNSIQNLSSIPFIDGLRVLEIENCNSLETMDGLVDLPDVERLHLNNNASLYDLDQIKNLPSLRRLYLDGLEDLEDLNDLLVFDSLFILDLRSNPKLINLKGLDSLKYVAKLVIEDNVSLESLEGLSNLSNERPNSAYGRITIKDNPSLVSLSGMDSLEKLESIFIANNDLLQNLTGLENLKVVEYGFSIIGNDGLLTLEGYNNSEGPSYTTFSECDIFYDNSGFIIRDNSSLESLSALSHLDRIFANFELMNNDNLKNLDGLENIENVSGVILKISDNDRLENLNGLMNLESIGFDMPWLLEISNNPMLENLSGLNKVNITNESNISIQGNENMTSLNGLKKPTELGQIWLSSNSSLTDISIFNNIQSISSIYFNNNDLIEDLDVFSNITSSINTLNLQDNDLLTDISGLKNIQSIEPWECNGFFIDGNLRISENALLSECAIMPICDAIISSDVTKFIKDNGVGCSSPEDINCDDVSISGFVFFDTNQNGVLDGGENGVSNIQINFDPPDKNRLTKNGGKYYQVCEEGEEYNITFPELDNYTLTSPTDQYTITFQSGNAENYDNNFGIYANEEKHEAVSNISSFPTRCNERIIFTLSAENIGAFPESGFLRLDFDTLINNIWYVPGVDSFNYEYNFLIWNLEDFAPFDYRQFTVWMDMPDESYTGEMLNFTTSISIDSAGTDVKIDEFTYSPTLLCSYDPNDKLVMPPGVYAENYTLKDQKLTYTVRFQNTGNAPAKDVTIIDTLDSFLDIETFRVVNSSFTPETSIDGREVTFLFKNINLPDSVSNERNSHGFVSYEITAIEEIEENTEITNTAHIIFDLNAPILTNTVKNTMVTTIPTNSIAENILKSYAVYPNPIHPEQRLIIDYELDDNDLDIKISMYNNLGQEVISQDGHNGINELDVERLMPGIYFVGLKSNGRLINASKVIIQN